ncbi:hypothetical protein MQM1_061 [Aeromonas phage vB_AsaP_MQM1]|nr:hypothetical protein MQM1_061 [Aeromonas phage vB_AsaP_MQM1]
MKHSKAYEQVFGAVGIGLKTVGKDADGKPVVMRVGKTARDKAKGHVAGKKNRRMFDDKAHAFVKV